MPMKSKSGRAVKKTGGSRRASTRTAGARARSTRSGTGSRITTDHDEIRRWAEARGAVPASVSRTKRGGEIGVLRLEFPQAGAEPALEEDSWDEWFRKFDESGLAFVYQDKTASGKPSRFNKLVKRETAAAKQGARRTTAKTRTAGSRSH